jgi:hypothetical protein
MVTVRNAFLPLLCATLLLVLLNGCGASDLTRGKAETMLTEWLQRKVDVCALNPLLRKKPEFSPLAAQRFCDGRVEVTGIQRLTDTSRAVEFKVITTASREPLQKWLAAMDALEQRLLTLPPKNVISGFFSETVYTDPTDGQRLVAKFRGDHPIQATDVWQAYQNLRKAVLFVLNNGYPVESARATFSLYDNGWRIEAFL